MYASLWMHGEVLQYDIRDPRNIKLVGRVRPSSISTLNSFRFLCR